MNQLMKVGWTWYPSVLMGFGLWTFLYILAVKRGKPVSLIQQLAFHAGTVVGLVALVSPLDELGDEYLFSAHMVQHLLLIFGAPPLWLIGTPGWLLDRILPRAVGKWTGHLVKPISAFGVFVFVMWFWHIPSLYGIAQENEGIHILEHLTYIGSGLIGWWPVMGPETPRISRPEPPVRMLYLFLLAVPCTVLASMLTFSHEPLYTFYVAAAHPFGLTALQDQHLAGLLMWLPTHMFLFVALSITFLKWFEASDRKTDQHTSSM